MQLMSSSGGSSGGSGGGPAPTDGRAAGDKATLDYSSTNVTTAAYVQIIAATSAIINELAIFSGTASTLFLAFGGAGSEVDKFYIPPGGFGHMIDIFIPAGTRLSVKAVDVTANSGLLLVSSFK